MRNYHDDDNLEIPSHYKLGIVIVLFIVLLLNF